MSAVVGECIVRRVNGRPVVERADKLIYVHDDLLAELKVTDDEFEIGPGVRYHVVGRSLECPGAMLCERVA